MLFDLIMITYLLVCLLLIPGNIWAAITPHLHSIASMRALHLASSIALMPALISIWNRRSVLKRNPLVYFLAAFLTILLVVNLWITYAGMGVHMGWLDHYFLAIANLSVIAYFFGAPELPSRKRKDASADS